MSGLDTYIASGTIKAMKKQALSAYFVESRHLGGENSLRFVFDDPDVAADTAARLRNLGLVVLEHCRSIDA